MLGTGAEPRAPILVLWPCCSKPHTIPKPRRDQRARMNVPGLRAGGLS